MKRGIVAFLLTLLLSPGMSVGQARQAGLPMPMAEGGPVAMSHSYSTGHRQFVCSAESAWDLSRGSSARMPDSLPDGELIFYELDPPLIHGARSEPVTLRMFIRGKHRRLKLKQSVGGSVTLRRKRLMRAHGEVASVFEYRFRTDSFAWEHGVDDPHLLSDFSIRPPAGRSADFAMRSAPVRYPTAVVRRAGPQAYYSSNVANIVIPELRDRLVGARENFSHALAKDAINVFFQNFRDVYDSIGVTIAPAYYAAESFGARHVRIQAGYVKGIGLDRDWSRDDSADYGSDGVLKGYEFYKDSTVWNSWNHEVYHNFGQWMQLGQLAGYRWTLFMHGPSIIGPYSGTWGIIGMPGSRLQRRGGKWRRSELDVVTMHPLQLYALGLIGRNQVPPIMVWKKQRQFLADGASPTGPRRRVTIRDVIDTYGPREGPTYDTWRSVLLVVSAEPLSQELFDYYNFQARRLEDPENEGLVTTWGGASWERSSGFRSDLTTRVDPRGKRQISPPRNVSYPAYQPALAPGFRMDMPLPSRVAPGQLLRLAGRVEDVRGSLSLNFWDSDFDSHGGGRTTIRSDGRFSLSARAPSLSGVYELSIRAGGFADGRRHTLTWVVVSPP